MSTSILSSSSRAAVFSGDAVDVSAFALLRLDLTLGADLGRQPDVTVYLETSPDGVTFSPLWSQRFAALGPFPWRASTRVVVSAFDSFVRVRTAGTAPGGLTCGLVGDGIPAAA